MSAIRNSPAVDGAPSAISPSPGSPSPGEQGFPGLERPLTARSVMASLLLGMHPPRLAAARLVAWCGLFEIAAGTARVALHRMVTNGDLVGTDGVYELAGALAQRQHAQDWSLDPRPRAWSGGWRIAVVDGGPRSAEDRRRLRDAMRRLRHVELREGVWLRPDNLPDDAAVPDALAVASQQCTWFSATPDDDVASLVARFEPEAWARRAHTLAGDLDDATAALETDPDGSLADAFVLGAAALTHVRADPLLPRELLGDGWPGERLRDAYHRYRKAFAAAVTTWFAR